MHDHNKTPVFTAMKEYLDRQVVPFDVPGHKHGRGLKEYTDFFGERMMGLDVNSMKPLDFLGNPTSVIKESEALLADAFGADAGFFIVNGTSFAVQVMIMATVKSGEKIILPRNVHKSAINALILCGAEPVYMEPEIDREMSIPHNITIKSLKRAYDKYPDAKAVLITNPTYYGACCDLKSAVEFCHDKGMMVLVDEAHGTHFHFNDKFPLSGMQAGADISAVSLHKTGGSLTQSSGLLIKESRVNPRYIRKIINLMQTTSPSYLLMGSLDTARKQLFIEGEEILNYILEVSEYARKEINKIQGCYAIGKEAIGNKGIYDFDPTKLSVSTRNMGLNGMELYDLLRDDYNIQMETGEVYNSLAVLSLGDDYDHVNALITALKDISAKQKHERINYEKIEIHYPNIILTPKESFYSEKEVVALENSLGRISGETLIRYPPGIPVISYGEQINESIIAQIKLFKGSPGVLTGTEDPTVDTIKVIKE